MINIIIADDHPIIREGLKKIILSETGIRVIGEASDGADLLAILRTQHPDVVVLDLQMPGMDGLEVLEHLKREHPDLRVLVISMHPEDSIAVRLLKTGASGYVSKNRAPEELVVAIRKIAGGRKHISSELAEKIAEVFSDASLKKPHEVLSNREFQILLLITRGKGIGEIAESLSLAPSTITTYRTRILGKMNMKSNAELIHYAIKQHLLE